MRRGEKRPLSARHMALLAVGMLIALVSPPAIAAFTADLASATTDCPASVPELAATARARSTGGAARLVEDIIDTDGVLIGRRLTITTPSGRTVIRVLPPESFAAPRAGSLDLYGSDAGRAGSRLWGVDAETGCELLLASTSDVMRSATADPAGTAVYMHSVSRSSRADLGIMRYRLVDGGTERVLPPLPADEGFGPTFATDMSWSLGGKELAVQSCGFAACRTRILDIASGEIATVDQPAHGALVALSGETLIVFGTCLGRPCELLAIDRETGSVTVLGEEVLDAAAPTSGDANVLRVHTPAGDFEVVL